jgi:putative DNA primase/helicase
VGSLENTKGVHDIPVVTPLIRYLQKAIGYSLSAHTHEQCLFIPHGEGSNGKSVFLKTIESILADYSTHCPADALMVKQRDGGANNEIARLRGARFVAAVETDEGKRLSESLVKELTGGDTISARFLFAEFFEFVPAFKIWLACNHKPVIRGTDHAIWRRIKLLPFLVTIPAHEQDKTLSEKLRAEASGILNWAIKGGLMWREEGLQDCQEVQAATAEYRSEMDVIGAWIADRCVQHPNSEGRAGLLYEDFKGWADLNGERLMSSKVFGLKLGERGFHKRTLKGCIYYIGLGLDAEKH